MYFIKKVGQQLVVTKES